MSSTSSKKSAPSTKTSAKSGAKPDTVKAKKAPIKKVPSPSEVAPAQMMNPKPLLTTKKSKASDDNTMAGPVLKKQELIQKVVEASGIKKKDAKPVVEAMLDVIGEALAEGREFNLQPMGKLKLNRTKETPNARIIVAKIRQPKRKQPPGISPVAAAAE